MALISSNTITNQTFIVYKDNMYANGTFTYTLKIFGIPIYTKNSDLINTPVDKLSEAKAGFKLS